MPARVMRPPIERPTAAAGAGPAAVSTTDVAHAVTVAVIGGGFAGGLTASWGGDGAPVLTAGVVAAEAVPLIWRRRAPVAVLVAVVALGSVAALLPAVAFTPLIAAMVAVYTVATERPWPVAAAAAVVAGTGLALVHGETSAFHVSVIPPPEHPVNFVAASLVVFAMAAGLGVLMSAWRARTARLADYAARLERERVERERSAVLRERARIARELHDVAAHHLSGLVLQAGALERTAADESEPVRQLAGDVRQGGVTALASMRRLVGLLRAADEGADGRGSQPSLTDLDDLVAAARRAGLTVDLAEERVADDGLPAEVGLAAYRIVQEALSNTSRHAPGAHATIRLARDDTSLIVEVTDDGGDGTPAAAADDGEPGHGLIGMRERATLLGGSFEAGPHSTAGWRVRAHLPIPDDRERP